MFIAEAGAYVLSFKHEYKIRFEVMPARVLGHRLM